MARILLYTDLSPSWPWVFATIHANRDMLAEHGIVLGPTDPWFCEIIPSQLLLWRVVPENAGIPQYLAKLLEDIVARLSSGRDVLLMTYTPNLMGQQSLARLIKRYIDTNKHKVRCIFTVGKPACAFEQRYREMWTPMSEEDGQAYVGVYSSLLSLINDAISTWGQSNVTLLANLSESSVSRPCDDLTQQLFSGLGCPAPIAPPQPLHPLLLASQEGRRLRWALEVRNNAFPSVDEALFMQCLIQAEQLWDTAPLSPKKLREALISNGESELRKLETLMGLDGGSLDCPHWLAVAPESQFIERLSTNTADAFASTLPASVAVPLMQRFRNDSFLLSEDQKVLASALSSSSRNYSSVGEPLPPVELTVLTMAFNHEKYIAECMESVLAQRTNFPVRHLVLDHHSSDDTPNIIDAYAAKHASIQPILLSQRLPSENVMGLFLRCRSPYAALCDGDDYFIDPLKLQKQVDFLEKNPHCSLCFHPVSVRYEGDEAREEVYPPLSMLPRGVRKEYYLADMLKGNMIQTNSVVYRWRFQSGMPTWFRPDICPGDWYWHLLHAELGKIGFLQETMSAYRRHRNALYYTSTVSTVEHRRIHGMGELGTYHAINEHFRKRYFIRLASLANGVFANFLEVYVTSGDASLLEQACQAYPEFGNYFLNSLDVVHSKFLQGIDGNT